MGGGVATELAATRFPTLPCVNERSFSSLAAVSCAVLGLPHGDGGGADIIILGVSRTSKTPTSIYLGERGFKVSNIPLVPHQTLPNEIFASEAIKIGLVIDPTRLSDVRKTRINILNDKQLNLR